MRSGASAEAAGAWWVQAAGRVWGPYSQARLEGFVAEGRVAAETLVGASPDGPFAPAGRQGRLHDLFGTAEPEPTPAVAPSPSKAALEPTAPPRPLLVWAALKGRADRLEQALAIHGPFVRIAQELWLVRARLGPAALRNALSRRLDAADMLMVVEAQLAQAAWFNIDGAVDRTLRQLWLSTDTE